MKKNTKFTFLLIILSVFTQILLITGCEKKITTGNLLINSGFEKGNNMPDSWKKDIWANNKELISTGSQKTESYEGSKAAFIESKADADAKLVQIVDVKPKTLYKLSGYIKAKNIPSEKMGANLSVLDVYANSPPIYDTGGEWVYTELYGRTGPKQKTIQVAVRIGTYGDINTGLAYFDKISLSEVSKAAPGKQTVLFYSTQITENTGTTETGRKTVPIQSVFLYAGLYIIFFILIYIIFIRKDYLEKIPRLNLLIAFGLVVGIGLLIRILIAPSIEGYQNDIACFRSWSARAASVPFKDYYAPPPFWCDYPPGYIYILAGIGHVREIFNITDLNSPAFYITLKLPAILADIATAFLIYSAAKKRIKESASIGLSLLYLFNPGVILNSAIWGQGDSIAALLVMLILIFIMGDASPDKKPIIEGPLIYKIFTHFVRNYKLCIAAVLTGIAIMVKLQAGFVAFILLYALIRKKNWKVWLASIGGGFLALFLTILPFNIGRSPTWIIELVTGTLSGYKYASVNAFNIMSLWGGIWKPLDTKVFFLSYGTWGYIFTGITLGYVTFLYFKAKDRAKNYITSLILIAGLFVGMTVMHERYMYPVLFLTLMSMVYTKDRRFLWLFIGFSITYFFNVGYVLDTLIKGLFIMNPKDPIMWWSSVGNIVLLLYLVKISINLFINDRFLVFNLVRKKGGNSGKRKNKKHG